MKFTVLTLFPELIENFRKSGLLGQAVTRGEVEISTVNPRQFTTDVHHTVDDRVYGGADGMVMKVEPLLAAVHWLRAQGECRVVTLTPQGRPWSQRLAEEYASESRRLVLVCGRYAGIDQRFAAFVDDEISLGDFILNGGEIAACAVMESVIRLKDGVLGNSVSAKRDSFTCGLLEAPQFTRPQEIEGMKVPSPLLSGNHAKIAEFEQTSALILTALRRPDLLPTHAPVESALKQLEILHDSELKALNITRASLQALSKGRHSNG